MSAVKVIKQSNTAAPSASDPPHRSTSCYQVLGSTSLFNCFLEFLTTQELIGIIRVEKRFQNQITKSTLTSATATATATATGTAVTSSSNSSPADDMTFVSSEKTRIWRNRVIEVHSSSQLVSRWFNSQNPTKKKNKKKQSEKSEEKKNSSLFVKKYRFLIESAVILVIDSSLQEEEYHHMINVKQLFIVINGEDNTLIPWDYIIQQYNRTHTPTPTGAGTNNTLSSSTPVKRRYLTAFTRKSSKLDTSQSEPFSSLKEIMLYYHRAVDDNKISDLIVSKNAIDREARIHWDVYDRPPFHLMPVGDPNDHEDNTDTEEGNGETKKTLTNLIEGKEDEDDEKAEEEEEDDDNSAGRFVTSQFLHCLNVYHKSPLLRYLLTGILLFSQFDTESTSNSPFETCWALVTEFTSLHHLVVCSNSWATPDELINLHQLKELESFVDIAENDMEDTNWSVPKQLENIKLLELSPYGTDYNAEELYLNIENFTKLEQLHITSCSKALTCKLMEKISNLPNIKVFTPALSWTGFRKKEEVKDENIWEYLKLPNLTHLIITRDIGSMDNLITILNDNTILPSLIRLDFYNSVNHNHLMLLLNSTVLSSKIKRLNIPLLTEIFSDKKKEQSKLTAELNKLNKSKSPKTALQIKTELIDALKKWTALNYLSVNFMDLEWKNSSAVNNKGIINLLRKELPFCFIPNQIESNLEQNIGSEAHLNRILFYS